MQIMTVRPLDPPRFRSDETFRITPRVLSILDAVARYSVLSADQIARLDGGSRQKISRILKRTVEHKLLRRADTGPTPLLSNFFDQRPRAYCITQKGLRALTATGMPVNASPKRSNVLLAHEIETAEAMFFVNAAVAAHGAIRLIDQPDLINLMPAATQALRKPLRLNAEVHPRDFPHLRSLLKEPTDIGTETDRLFALALPDHRGWSFALELDRGTEDVTARRLRGRATYFRKLLGYYNSWSQGKHLEQWGEVCRSFRVLTVTTSDTRINNMIAAQVEISRGTAAGLFLYTTQERLHTHGALGPAWISAKRDQISLLDRE